MNASLNVLSYVALALLLIVSLLSVVGFVSEAWSILVAAGGASLTVDAISRLMDEVLVIFIVIELFQIALAYIRHVEVLPIVFEATIVALVRKVIATATQPPDLQKALATAATIVAVSFAWFLIAKNKQARAG